MTDHSKDPTCGWCGRAKSQHDGEANGVLWCPSDVDYPHRWLFDDMPSDDIIVYWLARTEPNLLAELRRRWQIEHGHAVAVSEQKECDTCPSTESSAKSTDSASVSM